jgi:hypothetical protein
MNVESIIDRAFRREWANLSPVGDIQPTNERQVRPLTGLGPKQQREVWKEAVKTAPKGQVTAAHIEKVKAEKVACGEIPNVSKTTDTRGRQQPIKKTKPKQAETGEKVLMLSSTLNDLTGKWGPACIGKENQVYTVQIDVWEFAVKRVAPLIDAKAETGRAVRERDARNDAASR